ncbi:helix-turn-helix domain-containing protein [Allokutzneria sp. A3M-2-11 16]|uniref:PucR family transcriptional regulator n=1 Tax=Allokutzneria sp. A3M-2-11 16 TaxID=2962043 RepID=UPI0020B8E27E|nr:PucR family transcriptional regulator [Allokutzneria sp. A3M-2-11 16]MCP3801603.1 helix-turn-helix domain-containing protein [Allokutzneria sp. A3M-2-11 16]
MVALDRLVDVLGGVGAVLCAAPRGRDVDLRGVALHDPTEEYPTAPSDVLLGLGTKTVAAAVRLIGTTNAAVLVLHGRQPLDERISAAARKAGVAVLLVDPEVPWSHLAGVVHTLVLGGTSASREHPGDLFAVADAIAAVVGGPVTIEDQQSRVLAYSGRQEAVDAARVQTILGRRVPPDVLKALEERGVFKHLSVSDEPLVVPSLIPSLGARLVVAIRAGRELLGSVWVEAEPPISPQRLAGLVDGARTAALHLLRARASSDLERRGESDLVLRLVEGDADAPAVLARLGLPTTGLRVIALRADAGDAEHGAALLAFERATAGFGWSRPGRSALLGNVLYTVLPCGENTDTARDWVRALSTELPSEVVLHAGIGGAATTAELPSSRHEADECLAVSAVLPSAGTTVSYDEAWSQVLLLRLAAVAESGRLPSRGPVAELLRQDEENGTAYAETLRAWLAAQGDVRAAAQRLAVHPNTLRYRLRKIEQLTPVRLDDPEQRLALAIALTATTLF